jgi:hypothetical protein
VIVSVAPYVVCDIPAVSVVLLVEPASLYHGNRHVGIFCKASSDCQAGGTTTDYNIVVSGIDSWYAERIAVQSVGYRGVDDRSQEEYMT